MIAYSVSIRCDWGRNAARLAQASQWKPGDGGRKKETEKTGTLKGISSGEKASANKHARLSLATRSHHCDCTTHLNSVGILTTSSLSFRKDTQWPLDSTFSFEGRRTAKRSLEPVCLVAVKIHS
jgi:hypothetical protein